MRAVLSALPAQSVLEELRTPAVATPPVNPTASVGRNASARTGPVQPVKVAPKAGTPPGESALRQMSPVPRIVDPMDIVQRTTPAPATPALREPRVMTAKTDILVMTAGLVREEQTIHVMETEHVLTGAKGAVGVHAALIGLVAHAM